MFNLPETVEEVLFLGGWALVGSSLGYFAFADTSKKSPQERLGRYILSVGIGVFLAFPVYIYLTENKVFSTRLSMTIAGLGSFGLPDFVLKYYPIISRTIARKLLSTNKTNNHHTMDE